MHDITYEGIYCWSKSLFENFGWMILAHKNNDVQGLISYKKEIETLIQYVIEKLQYLYKLQEKDRNILLEDKINNMKILKDNLEFLHKFTTAFLLIKNVKPNYMNKNSSKELKMKKNDKMKSRKKLNHDNKERD